MEERVRVRVSEEERVRTRVSLEVRVSVEVRVRSRFRAEERARRSRTTADVPRWNACLLKGRERRGALDSVVGAAGVNGVCGGLH